MARIKRKKSKNGFYHVMVRGVNKEKIFFNDTDKKIFIYKIKKYSSELNVEVHAFCLMENHVHILLSNANETLSVFMQKLLLSYTRYINKKQDRVGHLFQDRFKSEVVEDEIYFKTVLRYILQNPQKAGICKMENYKWSSYSAYFTDKSFINTDFSINLFGNKSSLINFLKTDNHDYCMEYEMTMSEKEMYSLLLIKGILSGYSISDFKNLKKEEQNEYLRKMKLSGLSIRTISRICKIGKSKVYRA